MRALGSGRPGFSPPRFLFLLRDLLDSAPRWCEACCLEVLRSKGPVLKEWTDTDVAECGGEALGKSALDRDFQNVASPNGTPPRAHMPNLSRHGPGSTF